jgi:hypothetical protein
VGGQPCVQIRIFFLGGFLTGAGAQDRVRVVLQYCVPGYRVLYSTGYRVYRVILYRGITFLVSTRLT